MMRWREKKRSEKLSMCSALTWSHQQRKQQKIAEFFRVMRLRGELVSRRHEHTSFMISALTQLMMMTYTAIQNKRATMHCSKGNCRKYKIRVMMLNRERRTHNTFRRERQWGRERWSWTHSDVPCLPVFAIVFIPCVLLRRFSFRSFRIFFSVVEWYANAY